MLQPGSVCRKLAGGGKGRRVTGLIDVSPDIASMASKGSRHQVLPWIPAESDPSSPDIIATMASGT